MAPLGFAWSPRFGRWYCRFKPSSVLKRRDAAQDLAAMAQQNAEVLEIMICQVAEYREVNAVLGEALRVLR
jgi:hypothetical protein